MPSPVESSRRVSLSRSNAASLEPPIPESISLIGFISVGANICIPFPRNGDLCAKAMPVLPSSSSRKPMLLSPTLPTCHCVETTRRYHRQRSFYVRINLYWRNTWEHGHTSHSAMTTPAILRLTFRKSRICPCLKKHWTPLLKSVMTTLKRLKHRERLPLPKSSPDCKEIGAYATPIRKRQMRGLKKPACALIRR